jgi:hypothetical protein
MGLSLTLTQIERFACKACYKVYYPLRYKERTNGQTQRKVA